jgi:hypothetical protein
MTAPIGATHIFRDESGGSDRANNAFLASAVVIAPAEAHWLIKSLRKATRIDGEIKGRRLMPEQRSIFFGLLERDPFNSDQGTRSNPCVFASIFFRRAMPYGRTMLQPSESRSRRRSWSALAATRAAVGRPGACPRSIFIAICWRKPALRCSGQSIASHLIVTPDAGRYKKNRLEGVHQHVADVIANTVFQSFGDGVVAETANHPTNASAAGIDR